jgi:pimeloyl-ACP methyl ester carboxylesterase
MASDVITLPDGRRLSWHEFGDPDGSPVQELALISPPWPFPLSEVKTPVHLWHGALDANAPIADSRRLARALPDATLHVSDSSEHDIGHDRSDEITSVIASCVK